jgi:hypothetical protein
MKNLIAYTSKEPRLRLEIEKDEVAGFYLFVCPENSKDSIADYLQDTLDDVFHQAKEMYSISPDQWKEKR